MPPPFSLEYVPTSIDQPPTIMVTQDDVSGLRLRSSSGQRLWDSAQNDLDEFYALHQTTATIHIRLDLSTRDHRRTYCTVRAPNGALKYSYKFFCGVGEWVVTEIPSPKAKKKEWRGHSEDFYGRKTVPIDLEVFWGLNGLLLDSWYARHRATCHVEHYDIFVNMLLPDTDTSNLAKLSALCDSKKLTHLEVCADTKVATLFQTLIGLDTATKLNSLAHCLTEVLKPHGTEGEVRFGPEFLFEDSVRSGITVQETGWFGRNFCCLLVSTKRTLLNSKFKHTFMFQEVGEIGPRQAKRF